MRRSNKQIKEYLDEAFDKVWFVRSITQDEKDVDKLRKEHPDIYDGMMKARKRIEEKYGFDWFENMDNWDYGFISGVMATLRWVLGSDEKMDLDT